MAVLWAVGRGFFDRREQVRDQQEDEARQRRMLAMEVWMKDTLPRVRTAQARDTKAVELMNTGVADTFYAQNPEILFHATKSFMAGGGSGDFTKYLEDYKGRLDKDFSLPPEVLSKARATLGQTFDYTEVDGAFSNFALKNVPSAPAFPAQPKQEKRGFAGTLFSREAPGAAMRDMQEGAQAMAQAAGEDVNARTTSLFESAQMPSGIVKFKDPEDDTMFELQVRSVLTNPGLIRDPAKWQEALSGGRDAVKEFVTNSANFFSRGEISDMEFKDAFRKSAATYLIDNADQTKFGQVVAQAYDSSGNFSPDKMFQALGDIQVDKDLMTRFGKAMSDPDLLLQMANAGELAKIPESVMPQENIAAMVEMAATSKFFESNKDRTELSMDTAKDPGTSNTGFFLDGPGQEWFENAKPKPKPADPEEKPTTPEEQGPPKSFVEAWERAAEEDGALTFKQDKGALSSRRNNEEDKEEYVPLNTTEDINLLLSAGDEAGLRKADPVAMLQTAVMYQTASMYRGAKAVNDRKARTMLARNLVIPKKTLEAMSEKEISKMLKQASLLDKELQQERMYGSKEEAIEDNLLPLGGIFVYKDENGAINYSVKTKSNISQAAIDKLQENPDEYREQFDLMFGAGSAAYYEK